MATLGCEYRYSTGEHPYLTLESTKAQVLDQLVDSGDAKLVLPIISNPLSFPSRGVDIASFAQSPGIVVTGENIYARIEFNRGVVSGIDLSPTTSTQDLSIEAGQSRELALEHVRSLVLENRVTQVFEYLPGARLVELDQISGEDRLMLEEANAWRVEGADQKSILVLEFENSELVSIVKHWSPIELP